MGDIGQSQSEKTQLYLVIWSFDEVNICWCAKLPYDDSSAQISTSMFLGQSKVRKSTESQTVFRLLRLTLLKGVIIVTKR